MTTSTVPVSITCPVWCIRDAGEHAAELWNMDGDCIHLSADREITDTAGYIEPLAAPVFHPPVSVWITSSASPEGRESASPIVHLDGRELSTQQALALADALRDLVGDYRAAGGVA